MPKLSELFTPEEVKHIKWVLKTFNNGRVVSLDKRSFREIYTRKKSRGERE